MAALIMNVSPCFCLFLSALLFTTGASAAPDLIIADFEAADYGDWTVTGTAFGPGPARGTLPNQMAVDGFLGKGLVNSFHGGDSAQGTLTSPPFKIERPYIQFLIGGGKDAEKTCIQLLLDERPVRSATGPNDQPGGTERLDWHEWDVTELAGKTVQIQIVDQATGGWGHINIDQIIQTDRRLPLWLAAVERKLRVEQRYLNLPVKNGVPKRRVSFLLDNQSVREFEIELADRDPDFWVYMDLGPFQGREAVLRVDKLREDSLALKSVEQSDQIKGAADLYREELRPQFHFTSRRGWLNDPNGLVYFEGEYHLFYQHNPYGWSWGNMHWGHAVSPDLVHWRELGEALYPDEMGTMFSGSAVVDWHNTAGFNKPGAPALILIYTAAGGTSHASQGSRFTQCLAYSTDRGRSWTKYANNPVLPHLIAENRDPKVIWHAPSQRWIMALYLHESDFALFSSVNLKQWERLSDIRIPGTSECPEFFELPIDNDPQNSRWVFYGGNGRYLLGTFDGRTFTQESGPHPLNFGNCFYASQTFSDLPSEDGRRILIGWGQVNLPGMPFNQMMNFPVQLTLRNTGDGPRLFAYPVREIERLRGASLEFHAEPLPPGDRPLTSVTAGLLDIEAEFEPGQASEFGITVRGVPISYHAGTEELVCLDKKAPLKVLNGKIRLRLLVDRASIEIFANDGRLYMPMGAILDPNQAPLALFARGGPARAARLTVHPLNSIWNR